MKVVNWTQRLLLILGLFLIAIYVTAYIHKEISSRAQLQRFDSLRALTPVQARETLPAEPRFAVDFRLWSAKRITEYEESLAQHVAPPLAVLHISKFQLRVPVIEGTDELTLNLVRPDDVSVLQPRSVRSLTLVTCYPFYFIGSAPQRYIVRASITSSDRIGVAGVIEPEVVRVKASNRSK